MCRALLSDSEKPTVFIKFNVDGLLRGDYGKPHERLCDRKTKRMDERE